MKRNEAVYVIDTLDLLRVKLNDKKHRWTNDEKGRITRARGIILREYEAMNEDGMKSPRRVGR